MATMSKRTNTSLNTVARSNLRASKGKYVLTGIGIAVASFFIAAIIVLLGSLQGTMDAAIGDVLSEDDNVVLSAGTNNPNNYTANHYLTPENLDTITNDPSVQRTWVIYDGQGKLGTGENSAKVRYTPAPTDTELFPFPIDGKLPGTDTELLISKEFAEKHNLHLGSTVTSPDVVAAITDPNTSATKEYTIAGIFDTGFSGSFSNDNVYIGGTSYQNAADEALKQFDPKSKEALQLPYPSMTFVQFKGDDDAHARTELQKKLATGDQNTEPVVKSGGEYLQDLKEETSQFFAFIGVILGAFAALALLVSSFVISNTFAVLVGQRIRELALLRTLGAHGKSLVRMLLVEALVVGVIFSAIGAALVYPVAALAGVLFKDFMVSYDPLAFIVGVVVCTLVTVIASLAPARSALNISPISALGEGTAQAVEKPGIAGLILGLIAAAAGAAAVWQSLSLTSTPDASVQQSSVGVLLVMVAALLLGVAVFLLLPWLLPPLIRVFGSVIRSQTGNLAVANALRSPKRTVSTGRAVLVGVLVVSAVLSGYSIMTASTAKSMERAYPVSATATYGTGGGTGAESLAKAHSVADKVQGIKNVESVAVAPAAGALEYTLTSKDGSQSMSNTASMVALSQEDFAKVIPAEGKYPTEDNTVLVPESLYKDAGFDDSTRLKARGPLGEIELKPIKSTSKIVNLYVVNPATGAKLQNPDDPQPLTPQQSGEAGEQPQGSASQSGGMNPSAGAETMVLVHAKSPLTATENSTLQDQLNKANDGNEFTGGLQQRGQLDQVLTIMLGITLGLLALAVVISVIGVANTMTLSVNERRRENAMLRALGLSRKQLRRMISAEAVLITLGAVALGILGGVFIGSVSAKVVLAATDQKVEFVPDLPYLGLALILLVGLASALVASALPAARSARMSPVEGLGS
ncbi:ABC transporter permease [Rothia dentocariosa]|uniref:ABC transporter permease n=1 Tax=Rothia dentocariosa TaxID=2047 RepID=UPI001958298D|nr:ABC transporter permease [Rothia dentocariosa]VTY12437.1 ABC transporter permease YtrF [Rothia dentocariosa]